MRRVIKRPIGAYGVTKGSLLRFRPSPFPTGQNISPRMIPIKTWAQQNNYTVKQCHRLIRDRYLLAHKFKNCWMVAINPECVDENGNFLFE